MAGSHAVHSTGLLLCKPSQFMLLLVISCYHSR